MGLWMCNLLFMLMRGLCIWFTNFVWGVVFSPMGILSFRNLVALWVVGSYLNHMILRIRKWLSMKDKKLVEHYVFWGTYITTLNHRDLSNIHWCYQNCIGSKFLKECINLYMDMLIFLKHCEISSTLRVLNAQSVHHLSYNMATNFGCDHDFYRLSFHKIRLT